MQIQCFPSDFVAKLRNKLSDDCIRSIHLLWMPNREAIGVLGDAAKNFGGDGCDGDAYLAPVASFSDEQIAAALAAGGLRFWGYEFDYPQSIPAQWGTQFVHWRGDVARAVGYTLWFDVAVVASAIAIGILK